jgi:hypothetical protein
MKWVLIAVGGLVVLACVIALVGALLPKGHVASRQAHFKKPAALVFGVISDFAAAPNWRREVKTVELLPPREGKPAFREVGPSGPLVMVVEELSPPRRLVNRIVDQSAFGGTWTWELSDEPGGCRVAITERGEVYNPIFRLLGRFFFSPTATIERYLTALGEKLGERTSPEPL